jgi:xanthine dehydrogenase accessory factor
MSARSLVIVRGGGDLGTGVAATLHRSGYRVVVLEAESPTVVRRAAAFAEAVFSGEAEVDGISARRVEPDVLSELARARASSDEADDRVPVVVDPDGRAIRVLRPRAVVDARMAKVNLGTGRGDAPVTIGLGPGFEAGRDVDLVIETKRGDSLGLVIESGAAAPDTGLPGEIAGVTSGRVMRSPADGTFESVRSIGDLVDEGDVVGHVAGRPVRAGVAGLVRGLVADGVRLSEGAKAGDVDPRGSAVDPAAVSDKAAAVGGAVLEALLGRGVVPVDETNREGTVDVRAGVEVPDDCP